MGYPTVTKPPAAQARLPWHVLVAPRTGGAVGGQPGSRTADRESV